MTTFEVTAIAVFLCGVAFLICVPSWIDAHKQARRRSRAVAMRRHPASQTRIDALIESALVEGITAPAPDAEVTRRIRAHMDAAVAELRDELDTPQNWSA